MAAPETRTQPLEEPLDVGRLAAELVEVSRYAYGRGWALGTSGNFSAVLSLEPLRLLITPSGADKARLEAAQIVEVDEEGRILSGAGRPSDETRLHLAVVRACGARAVIHTHSVWSTLLSEAHAGTGGVVLEGYEMLKGLAGVSTHEHRERLPVL